MWIIHAPLYAHTHLSYTYTPTHVHSHILIPFSWGRDYVGPINLFLKRDLVYGRCRFHTPPASVLKWLGLVFTQDSRCSSMIFTFVSQEEKNLILLCQEILTCTQANICFTCLC